MIRTPVTQSAMQKNRVELHYLRSYEGREQQRERTNKARENAKLSERVKSVSRFKGVNETDNNG
jgi:hypothetical protein